MSEAPDNKKGLSPIQWFALVQVIALVLLAYPVYQAITAGAQNEIRTQVVPESPVDEYGETTIDETRKVTVRMTTETHDELPWEFEVETDEVTVHPGERKVVMFDARNPTDRAIDGKAIYDITPPEAAAHFKKVECFCFTQQTLEAGEAAEMPVQFWLDPDLPDEIDEVTVNYRFFNMKSSVRGTAQR